MVNVSQASATATASSGGGISGPLSVGGIVGVVIGGVVGVLAVLGCCVVIFGRRKRRAFLRAREEQQKHWPAQYGVGPEMYETPVSQRPLRNWDESPVSAATDHTYPQYFSPYNSNYSSPVSAADAIANHNMHWPTHQGTPIGVALSPEAEQNPYWGDRKGKDREAVGEETLGRNEYEMQEGVNSGGGNNTYVPRPHAEPPMLGHPGYGRRGPSPEQQVSDGREKV